MIRGLRVFTTVVMLLAEWTVLYEHRYRLMFLAVFIGTWVILLTDIIGMVKRPKTKQP